MTPEISEAMTLLLDFGRGAGAAALFLTLLIGRNYSIFIEIGYTYQRLDHGGRGPGLCPGVHFRRTRP